MSKKETLHIYVRCSTKKQIDTSVERQKKSGIKFSKQMGMKYKLWIDGGKSRFGGLDKRNKMSELLLDIQLGSVKHLWVEDWSRLTGEISGTQEIEMMILDDLVKVYEGLRGNVEYRPHEVMERSFQYLKTMMGSSVKQDEIRKSIKTKIDLHNQGYWMRGKVPFGYKSKDRLLKINKKNKEWVKKIFSWYGNDNLSLNQIVKELKLKGVKSPNGLDDWGIETISQKVLRNEIYIGKNHYTDKTKDPHHSPIDKDRNRRRHPYEDPSKWEVHTIPSPKIIDEDLFNKVQKKLNRNKPRPTKRDYLLHGKVKCKCGEEFVGRWYHKYQQHFYHCLNNERGYYKNTPNRKHLHKNTCDKPKRVSGSMMDDYVWNNLLKTLRNSSFIKERVKRDLLGDRYGVSSVRRKVNKDIKETNKELNTFLNNRVQFIKDRYINQLSNVDYKDILSSIDMKINECKNKIDELNKKNEIMDKRTEWIDWLKEHNNSVNDYEKVVDVRGRRRIIDFYINQVSIDFDPITKQHTIDIEYKYPIVGDGLIYKGSKLSWDKWGKGYRIKKGENTFSLSSSNFFLTKKNYQTLLNSGSVKFDSSIPFIKFHFVSKTHRLNPSPYYRPLSSDRENLHTEIMKLHNKGWGYTKIHHHLLENGFKIGKSRTTVDTIIKKRKERDRFFNQKITEDYNGFDIQFVKIME